jgi:1-deoxyxylulose-5-phosphate synthase
MNYRRLGRSGFMVSELVLGTMNFGNSTPQEEAFRIIDSALDRGVNLLDCADAYAEGESERILGRALSGNGKRKEIFITSKVFMRTGDGPNEVGNSKHHILSACESSLRRLKTDYIDLYFLHRTDWNVPQEETLAAMDLLVRQGKVRHVGCSTHPPWRVVEAYWIADKHHLPKVVCEQPPYNLLDRRAEIEIIPMCLAYDIGILCWSPLAQGVLAGRYKDARHVPQGSRAAFKKVYGDRITQQGIDAAQRLGRRADEKGCSLAQLAVAWLRHQPGITGIIVGPRTLEHLDDLLVAADVSLDDSDLEFCNSLVPPGAHVSDHFNSAGWKPPTSPGRIQ